VGRRDCLAAIALPHRAVAAQVRARTFPHSGAALHLQHLRALREREHRRAGPATARVGVTVAKLLLIIGDCRISAIASLQNRHTLRDNAGWDIISARQQLLLNCHRREWGYPRFPLKEIAVCRTAYVESDAKDLVFG
jgi:hypothetical protein